MINESIEFLILDIIKNYASIMPLFKAGYSYSKVMEWSRILEKEGKITYYESGEKELTKVGEERWKALKIKRKGFTILPLSDYKIPKLGIDEIFLP